MEKLNKNQIDQFLNITKEVTASADHIEISNRENLWGGEETGITVTLTTSMTTTGVGI